jgi:hypothetical protein
MRIKRSSTSEKLDVDARGFREPEAQSTISDSNFDWIAEGRDGNDLDNLIGEESHFHEPLNESRLAANELHTAAGADR